MHVLRNHVLGVFWPPPSCDYLICTWMIPNTNLSNLDFSQGASGHTLVRHETVFWRLHYVCDIAEQRRAGCRRSRPRISSEKRAAQVLRLRFHSHFCRGVHPQSKPLLFLFQLLTSSARTKLAGQTKALACMTASQETTTVPTVILSAQLLHYLVWPRLNYLA